jgi:hypothetical protein
MEMEMDTSARPHTPVVQNPNFAVLGGEGSDAKYFAQLGNAFTRLLEWHAYRQAQSGEQSGSEAFESMHLRAMLERLSYTLETLSMKHSYLSPEHEDRPRIDLTNSGFPNRHEISELIVDLSMRDKTLRELEPESLLKAHALNKLFLREHPADLLHRLCSRAYLEMLDESKLFLPFVPGHLTEWREREEKGVRGYITGWACYGAEKNAPFIYVMHFDQDTEHPALHKKAGVKELAELSDLIKKESSYMPPLVSLATVLDELLTPIHPKFLKRIRLGPFYSRLLLEQQPEESLSYEERTYLDLLRLYGEEDDFILMCSEEILFSKGEHQGTRFLVLPTKVRQVFYVPPSDRDAFEAGNSRTYHYTLMPHRVLQHLSLDDAAQLPNFARCVKKIGYDKQGNIHEVS